LLNQAQRQQLLSRIPPPCCDVTHITLAHCDAVGRGHPPHQFSVTINTKGSFPTEEAATKLIFLAIRNFEKGGRNVREWVAARNQLTILFAGRFDA
jgi:hypothetical protein